MKRVLAWICYFNIFLTNPSNLLKLIYKKPYGNGTYENTVGRIYSIFKRNIYKKLWFRFYGCSMIPGNAALLRVGGKQRLLVVENAAGAIAIEEAASIVEQAAGTGCVEE
jgi:hypothetical protein